MMTANLLTPSGQVVTKRYYVHDAQMPFDEDLTHEFKAHLNLACEEVPANAVMPDTDRPTRQAVSRAINGFLNSGEGGVVYLGIVDNKAIKGFYLHQYRMDHVRLNLTDLMSRYDPPVEPHRYHIEFIPVAHSSDTDEEDLVSLLTFDPLEFCDAEQRQTPHRRRSNRSCWCDDDIGALMKSGVFPLEYVIEIHIELWDPNDERNKNPVGPMRGFPIHKDETKQMFVRKNSSVDMIDESLKNAMITDQEQLYYQNEKAKMLKEKEALLKTLAQKKKR